jgi:hypothetical protein
MPFLHCGEFHRLKGGGPRAHSCTDVLMPPQGRSAYRYADSVAARYSVNGCALGGSGGGGTEASCSDLCAICVACAIGPPIDLRSPIGSTAVGVASTAAAPCAITPATAVPSAEAATVPAASARVSAASALTTKPCSSRC